MTRWFVSRRGPSNQLHLDPQPEPGSEVEPFYTHPVLDAWREQHLRWQRLGVEEPTLCVKEIEDYLFASRRDLPLCWDTNLMMILAQVRLVSNPSAVHTGFQSNFQILLGIPERRATRNGYGGCKEGTRPG